MRNSVWIFILGVILLTSCNRLEQEIHIVPEPVSINQKIGSFILNSNVTVYGSVKSESVNFSKEFLLKETERRTGIQLELIEDEHKSSQIQFKLLEEFDDKLGKEGYRLNITSSLVVIESATEAGMFYGLQSLLQIIPVEKKVKVNLPAVEIEDYPRFQYRGMHLDVCRHFYDVDFVKRYIDLIALHKMNRFHWHLTEDQGWRIEIKKYPELTKISSFREEKDGSTYGGFYSQDEVKEIVKYASNRHVTIIPEIELPGHSLAALAAYPELSCTGGSFKVANRWGVFKDVYCAGNEKTFQFLEDVLLEVIELFPSEYIHIGGDECPKARWEECPKCQKRMKKEGLKDEHELQSYFIQRIEKFLLSKGKKIIGWDEILEGGLAPEATVMSWRGISGGIAAAKQGHDVIMTPNSHCYFDHYQGNPEYEPKAIGGFTDLEKIYHYEPIPDELSSEEAKFILGAQANLWTEYIETEEHAEYMVLPRMTALSEVLWTSKENKSWEKFKKKIPLMNKVYQIMDFNYHVPIPEGPAAEVIYNEKAHIEFDEVYDSYKIYYTTDGSEPNEKSSEYIKPFDIQEDLLIKAVTISNTGKRSVIRTFGTKFKSFDEAIDIKNMKLIHGIIVSNIEGSFSSCKEFKPNYGNSEIKQAFEIEADQLKSNFANVFETYLYIKGDGVYTFKIGSDDGSMLYLNDKLVIDNDGLHGFNEKIGQVALKHGYHKLKIKYFERSGGNMLTVQMKEPKGEFKKLPKESLYIEVE